MVKEELSSEEKMFERSVIVERFVKKYKKPIIALIAFVAFGVTANIIYQANQESKALSANESLLKLRQDPANQPELNNLKTQNLALYDLYLYSKALQDHAFENLQSLQNSKANLIAELAHYESLKTLEELQAYTMQKNAIYKDLAQVRIAIIHINNGDVQSAHESLRFINEKSPLINVVQLLLHYGVK